MGCSTTAGTLGSDWNQDQLEGDGIHSKAAIKANINTAMDTVWIGMLRKNGKRPKCIGFSEVRGSRLGRCEGKRSADGGNKARTGAASNCNCRQTLDANARTKTGPLNASY